MKFGEPAEPDTDHLEPLDQQIIGAGGRRGAGEKPEDQDAPAPGADSARFIETRPIRVIDDVDTAGAGQLYDLVAQAAR